MANTKAEGNHMKDEIALFEWANRIGGNDAARDYTTGPSLTEIELANQVHAYWHTIHRGTYFLLGLDPGLLERLAVAYYLAYGREWTHRVLAHKALVR